MKQLMFAVLAAFAVNAAVAEEGEAKFRVAEAEMWSEKFDEEADGLVVEPGMVSCLAAVTNSVAGGASFWVTHDGERRVRLSGVEPVERVKYALRIEVDFTGDDTLVRYLVKDADGAFKPLVDATGAEWIRSPSPRKKTAEGVEIRYGEGTATLR